MKKHLTFVTIGILMLSLGFTSLSANPILGARKINDAVTSSENDSYGWSMAVHQQNGRNYLWLGTNRDLGGMVALSAAENPQLALTMIQMFGLTFDPNDQAGKIYRMPLGGDENSWELMYENPVINGWRKMLIFNDNLYVFAGLTNRFDFINNQPIVANNWSAIFRFGPDFQFGDTPEIVMWETLPGAAIEYFRAGIVTKNAQGEDEFLYIGTASGKVWRTDGTGTQALTPNQGEGHTGWELVVDLADEGYIGAGAMIWDLIAFNGNVYAFVANQIEGFNVFRLNGNSVTPIVSRDGIYQPGLGIRQHVAASPFIVTIGDRESVYVTTFANGPNFLATLIQGDFATAFGDVYMPAAMYRFDASGNWEVVVGDEFMARRNDNSFVPFAEGADERAGFFLGNTPLPNSSSNQYIWWMEQHEGRIFAATWDMGNFREGIVMALGWMASQTFDSAFIETAVEAIVEVGNATNNLITSIVADLAELGDVAGEVMEAIQDDFAELTAGIMELFGMLEAGLINQDEFDAQLEILFATFQQTAMTTIQEIADEHGITGIEDLFDLDDAIADLMEAIGGFVDVVEDGFDQAAPLLEAIMASGFYLADNTNPPGLDLFVSDDGVTWEPVTVTGFGDAHNYGGRVILSTDYGLFLTTANPFTGFDIFIIEEFFNEMDVVTTAPIETVELEIGQSFTFQVQTAFFANTSPTVVPSVNITSANAISELYLENTEETPNNTFVSRVDIVSDILGSRFVETELGLTTGIHEITLTFFEIFEGEVTVTAEADDLDVQFVLNVRVSEPTSILDLTAENVLIVYPNPVTDELRITNDELRIGDIVELFDMNGRRVFSHQISHLSNRQFTIDMSPFPSGIYILRIGEQAVRIVKQ